MAARRFHRSHFHPLKEISLNPLRTVCVIDRMNYPFHSSGMYWRWIVLGWLFSSSIVWAQAENIAVRLANLEQDLRRTDQVVNTLRLDLEEVLRDNARLKQSIQQELTNSRRDLVTLKQLNERLAQLTTELEASLGKSQKATIDQVATQIESLAQQTQKAIASLAGSVRTQPQIDPMVSFNDNFPKTGISYTVQPGDSLAKIATQHNSTVDWIRNANRIAGDLIHPNQQLFIPQKE